MDNDDVTAMIAAAALAPSVHNSQPWRFQALENGLQVYADPDRAAPAIDPDGRLMLISCGAAIYNAALVARARGRRCAVALTDGAGLLLATLTLMEGDGPATEDDTMLAAALPARHTMREPFDAQEVPAGAVAALRQAVEAEGAWLSVLNREDEVVELAVLTDRAEADEQDDPDYQAELASWLRGSQSASTDGVPLDALAGAGPRASDVPLRSFTPWLLTPAQDAAPPDVERPLLVIIGTDRDGRADRLRAGLALQHLLLRATSAGLAASPLSQALDRPAARAQLRHLIGVENGHPQMVLRIGHGVAVPHTGRRPVEDLLQPPRARTPV